MNYFCYSIEVHRKALHHLLLDLKLRVNHVINCKNLYNWKGKRFSSFQSKLVRGWCKSGSRTPGSRTRDPLKVGPRTSLKFKSGTLGPFSNFKSWTLGPTLKFKSRTPSSFLNELIFFRIFHQFLPDLIFCLF